MRAVSRCSSPWTSTPTAPCVQGTADMYSMEVEDIARSHDNWKARAVALKAQLVLRDKEIDKLVRALTCRLVGLQRS